MGLGITIALAMGMGASAGMGVGVAAGAFLTMKLLQYAYANTAKSKQPVKVTHVTIAAPDDELIGSQRKPLEQTLNELTNRTAGA